MKKILIIILSLVFCLEGAKSQITAIPDTAFEQKLITLGVDSDGLVNGQILTADAAVVTSLDVSQSQINSLTGIEAFVNLSYLNCSGNSLSSLNVNSLSNLDTLICYFNQITSLNVSNNIGLKTLICYNNRLQTLDVSALTALVELECAVNDITSLNLTNNSNLQVLNCVANLLQVIDVSNNPDLRVFNCSNNQLSSLNVSNNPLLWEFKCKENNLTSLDITNNLLLVNFYCDNNQIESLDFSNQTNLVTLFCPNNNLHTLILDNTPSLYHLHAQHNELRSLNLSTSTSLHYFYAEHNKLNKLDFSGNPNLVEVGCWLNLLSNINLSTNDSVRWINCSYNLPFLRICVSDADSINVQWIKDNSAIYTEECYGLAVQGQVVMDLNSNCLMDSTEQGFQGAFMRFERVSDSMEYYFSSYDTLGMYTAYLDTGTYVVTVIPNNPYWTVCPTSQLVRVDSNYTIQMINWALQPLINCPMLEVDLSAPFLRMTNGGSYYTISYCNQGTLPAYNAYVELDLDADLNYLSSTLPVASQTGRVYTFNLGTVAAGACGSFYVQVVVDTSALATQTHCTEVHIFPDSICTPIWSGPIVDGDVNCGNDTVFFHVVNNGTVMTQNQGYTIIEDDIAMRVGTINLGAGQSTIITQVAAPAKTYRIEIEQTPGFPALLGDSIYSSAIEGCNPLPDQSFNTGFMTQFSNGNRSPFIAVDCQQNIASYDPNDKAAQPEGYGLLHYIEKNTAIDYKVRFQNTGTDTAFNIVIIDTLSPYVDVLSLQMGASSHSYSWEIVDNNVLKVSFNDIMLVDSNANEPLSHGFFRYRIEQQPNNPLGSVIYNQAAIYFDYNPAILTNTTFHTVGENFVMTTVSVDQIYEEKVKVTAFPNPFRLSTMIKVEGKEYELLNLSVFDVTGREVARQKVSFSNQIELTRGNLQAGIYFYRLSGDDKMISSGKVVVE